LYQLHGSIFVCDEIQTGLGRLVLPGMGKKSELAASSLTTGSSCEHLGVHRIRRCGLWGAGFLTPRYAGEVVLEAAADGPLGAGLSNAPLQ
jgi:hypothetical protein